MTTPVCIAGGQIDLRDWREADFAAYAAWLAPGHRWKDLDAPYYPGPRADQIPSIIAHRRDELVRDAFAEPRTSLVIADAGSDSLLGMVTWYWESRETNWPQVGIAIYDPAAWGHGRGYAALGLWSDYLFAAPLAFARLDLRTWSGNPGMMRLAIKLGYREEARFRQARIVGGAFYDGLGYGILREEWQARYPHGFAAQLTSERSETDVR